MTTLKPLCIALTGTLALSIPFQQAQAATFFGDVDDQPVETEVEVELTSGNNMILDPDFDLDSLIIEPADDPENGIELVTSNNFVYAEPEVAEEIPEPSTLLGLLFVGLFSKFAWKKQ
ncbi:MAG: PEP-CTERM sorting domain-containing protein [Lyngbya sp.]|nr:PEP-CTERM sorting domain-containing protein [Lyngbya sp.]